MGYEAFALGKKVACFNLQKSSSGTARSQFGYCSDLPDVGPFLTFRQDSSDFDNVMNYITQVDDDGEWILIRNRYIDWLMCCDSGNIILLNLLRKLSTPLL
jgi:surface carbohydrate biosynthesis protein